MELNFPPVSLRTLQKEGKTRVFDVVRKKFVAFSPEENVRQHLIHYLIGEMGYSPGLMGVEKSILLHGVRRRFDLLVYSSSNHPFLLAECKSPEIILDQKVIWQLADYNFRFRVPYLLITNGRAHFCFHYDKSQEKYLPEENLPLPG